MNSADTDTLFGRGVAKILPDKEGLEKLASKRKLRVYIGVDPTGSRLHLGHTIGFRKLMQFADAGHEAILLFGTGTVLVGDPSLRENARETIDQAEIDRNIANWKEQAAKVIDFDKVTLKENGEWLTKMTLKDIVDVASKISAVQLFKRDSFTRRLEKDDTVWYHETLYPLLQGYDSVVMDVDLEIGGTDQEFNMLMGRELQKKINNKEKYVLETPMILGTDGKQMSKSSGNCVWLDDSAQDMYGKLMSLPDEQIIPYAENVSGVSDQELIRMKADLKGGANPRDIKAKMALAITRMYHSQDEAQKAAEGFVKQFSQSELPDNVPEITVKPQIHTSDLLVVAKLVDSKSEARRMIEQKAVKLNQQLVAEDKVLPINDGDVIQVGKRRFARLKI